MTQDFLFWEGDWIREKYGHLEFINSIKYGEGLKIGLNLLRQERKDNVVIIETGTTRVINDPAGACTQYLADYAEMYGGHVWTVDINPQNIETCKKATAKFDNITYVASDSVAFLEKFDKDIDFLFLDSMDCPLEGDATPAQEHQLKEFLVAEKHLKKGAVLVLDDTNFPNGGKTRLLKRVIVYSRPQWKLLVDRGQTVFYKVE